jgi:sortase A
MTRVFIGGATALLLVTTPVMGTLAAPGSSHTHSAAVYQDDDSSGPQIVPRGSDDGGDANSDDDVASDDEDTDANADDKTKDDDEDKDDEKGDERGEQIFVTGIVPAKVDLAPEQWAGALDERLLLPFVAPVQPVHISSSAIDLDADTTAREIVNGEMQTPKDEFEVTWYKDTANPGEKGNMVFAGHLNWYGVPQAVFYNINQFKKGDKITVKGEDGADYIYKVKWVKLVATADPDLDDIVGPTKKASLTLITCGGEWDPTVSLYTDRTVVRAEFVKRVD